MKGLGKKGSDVTPNSPMSTLPVDAGAGWSDSGWVEKLEPTDFLQGSQERVELLAALAKRLFDCGACTLPRSTSHTM